MIGLTSARDERASTKQSKKLIPKIHILYKFKSGPWGGGNQFLKALRTALTQKGVYAETLDDSGCGFIQLTSFW